MRKRTDLSGMTDEQKLDHRRMKAREKSRRWRAANPEKHRAQVKEWQEANPERLQEYQETRTKRQAGRLQNDPEFANRRRAQWREWARINRDPDEHRRLALKRLYGITLPQYDEMLALQGGRCAICGTDKPGNSRVKYFAVDHCHKSGHVRKLLCIPCNQGIGMLKDDPELLRKAAAYLER